MKTLQREWGNELERLFQKAKDGNHYCSYMQNLKKRGAVELRNNKWHLL